MQSIGYRHIQPVVAGSDTLVNALAAMKVDTRRFARRQRTWIRSIPEAHWHDPSDRAGVRDRVEAFLSRSDSTSEEGAGREASGDVASSRPSCA